MSIIFSRQCEYGLQAVLFLALKPRGEMTSIRELTDKLEIPYHFVAKILQDLTRKGLLVSHKGPSGGFSLGLPSEEITLYHIVEAIDGSSFLEKCVFGFPDCDEHKGCAVHNQWATIRDGIKQMLVSKNILEMASVTNKPQYKVHK
jgi:Rrf2 family transcriptional regulator, iron-sulfur cluster assembly transcription factor